MMMYQLKGVNPRWTAVLIGLFPVLLMVGIMLIPVVSDYGDHAVAEQAVAQTGRWFWGHLLSGLAFGLSSLVACFLALYVLDEGVRWGITAVFPLTLGAALLTFGMGADGIGPVALLSNHQSPQLFFDGSTLWVVSTFVSGMVLFTLGQIILLVAIQHTELMSSVYGKISMIAAVLFSTSSAIPSGWGLYVLGVMALVIYLPLSHAFWKITPSPSFLPTD